MNQHNESDSCLCGQERPYTQCCGPFIAGNLPAPTAQLLMRSRYSAFVECNEAYLLATWHSQTRPSKVRFDSSQRWLGLAIKSTLSGGEADDEGEVEFVARYKIAGKGYRLRERSRFKKVQGRWYYLEGDHL